MKKVISLVLFACLFVGCSIDNDDRLVGTCWYTQDINYEQENGGVCDEVYDFISSSEVECYTTQNGKVVANYGVYTYKLTYPYIRIVTNKGIERNYTFVDTRTMILDDVDENDYYATYFLIR